MSDGQSEAASWDVPVADSPQLLGKYEIMGSLGSGSVGETYVARPAGMHDADASVCLKVLRQELLGPRARGHVRDQAVRSLEREVEIAEVLDHPNIARVLDHGSSDGVAFVAFELVDGPDLGTIVNWCDEGAGIAPGDACLIALEVAKALGCAHSQDVLHRDIKPSNIVIGRDGCVKLVDFGLAKPNAAFASSFSQVGTPRYWAPEQVVRGNLGPATDVFALGAVLVEMLVGQPLFDGQGERRAELDALPMPNELRTIAARCLRPRPEDRYRSAAELARALRRALRHMPPPDLVALVERTCALEEEAAEFCEEYERSLADEASTRPVSDGGPSGGSTWFVPPARLAALARDGVLGKGTPSAAILGDLATVGTYEDASEFEDYDEEDDDAEDLESYSASEPSARPRLIDAVRAQRGSRAPAPAVASRRRVGRGSMVAAVVTLAVAALTVGWSSRSSWLPSTETESERVGQTASPAVRPSEQSSAPISGVALALPPSELRPGGEALEARQQAPQAEIGDDTPAEGSLHAVAAEETTQASRRRVEVLIGLYPPGSEVYVDGRRVGAAPVQVRVRPGRHRITGKLGDVQVTRTVVVSDKPEPIMIDLEHATNR